MSRFTVSHDEMVKKAIMKTKFSQLNDKRFYFADGVVSLPYGHPSLKEIDKFKKEKDQKIEKYFWEQKERLLKMEKNTLKKNTKPFILSYYFNGSTKNI